jgi:hypothetical protein
VDVEKTIEILLKQQARADARFNAKFDRADKRFRKAEAGLDRLERVVAQSNRIVTRLARYGVSIRSDIRRLTLAQAATDRQLRALIQTMMHRDGGRP